MHVCFFWNKVSCILDVYKSLISSAMKRNNWLLFQIHFFIFNISVTSDVWGLTVKLSILLIQWKIARSRRNLRFESGIINTSPWRHITQQPVAREVWVQFVEINLNIPYINSKVEVAWTFLLSPKVCVIAVRIHKQASYFVTELVLYLLKKTRDEKKNSSCHFTTLTW